MKRFHFILILGFAVATSFLLWQRGQIRSKESSLRESMARHAKPAAPPTSGTDGADKDSATKKHSRPAAGTLDPDRFMAELNEALHTNGSDPQYAMLLFVIEHRDAFATASLAELTATCARLEETGIDSGKDIVWEVLLMSIAKSDPTAAITRFDKVISARDGVNTIQTQLKALGKNGQIANHNWNPVYAAALGKWLDSAQAAGRLKDTDGQVAATRFEIGLVTGDLSGAARQLTLLPSADQSRLTRDLAKAANTPEQRRQLIEQANTAAGSSTILELARSFAKDGGYEATRDLLANAKLTPESHDLAAAGIATARIGPDTAARATWLLESLRSDQPAAVTDFTVSWTQADHKGAAQWLNSLPAGKIRDAAVAGFAPAAAGLDGASAVEWALTLSDPAQRDATLTTVYQTWVKQEPEAAATYLKQKGIDPK